MLKGFKDFIMKGDVVKLAVAVIIATAFTDIVKAIGTYLINPLIAAIGGANVNGLAVKLVRDNDKSVLDFGAILTAAINFVIIAAVVYFLIVLPYEHFQNRRKRGDEDQPEPTSEELLTEIRDLLRQGAR
ncbi:large conductance mechanosensitive channel [Herbihabitans rhizosphaerae]|uniref:Large-conductance mechanosensitive channel n=1 Tax=Herbihabitans rhizosphaerae TaxID=1872711 RepID=A0A4Q7KV63_9PSEU|nr:large conductance mechanosensitive channel protein MscL [Herbihabitans rhizosphaerae]RZS40898.1 large conductance mechanosensitive channel [Herbihabitans rhizosphaerae]